MWGTLTLSLDQEDPLEEEMITHSSTLAWKIPQMEEPVVHEVARVRHDLVTQPPPFAVTEHLEWFVLK